MVQNIRKNMVVQFNEKHKWCACIGIISETKSDGGYLIGVPIPNNDGEIATAFIFANKDEFEVIGEAALGFED